jgi:hypothetical protein
VAGRNICVSTFVEAIELFNEVYMRLKQLVGDLLGSLSLLSLNVPVPKDFDISGEEEGQNLSTELGSSQAEPKFVHRHAVDVPKVTRSANIRSVDSPSFETRALIFLRENFDTLLSWMKDTGHGVYRQRGQSL